MTATHVAARLRVAFATAAILVALVPGRGDSVHRSLSRSRMAL